MTASAGSVLLLKEHRILGRCLPSLTLPMQVEVMDVGKEIAICPWEDCKGIMEMVTQGPKHAVEITLESSGQKYS